MENKKSVGWAGIFGIASVWFGTHVGSGFATGAQGLSFFAQYGWTALFMPALSMLIVVAVHYARRHLQQPDCGPPLGQLDVESL